jgi:hypothetical protein
VQLFLTPQIRCKNSKLRVSKLNNIKSEKPLADNIKQIYGEIGMAGLWRGLGARIFMVGTLTGF